jgi:hypothetical protein
LTARDDALPAPARTLPRALRIGRGPLAAWALSRALVLVFGVAGSLALGLPERGVDPAVPRALSLLGGWDTTWYLRVARFGYEHDTGQVGEVFSNLAFYPLLPGIMALALALGLNPFLVALAASNLAFLGALYGVHALTRARFGEAMAVRTTWTLALFPTAVVASMAYTEALTLALAAAAAVLATRGRFALAGLVAAPAALARPPGILVAVLVALIAWRAPGPGRPRRITLALAPSLAAAAAFLVWLQVARGDWSLSFAAQRAWDRGQPVIGLVTALPKEVGAAVGHVVGWELFASWTAVGRDLAFTALFVWLLVRLWRREGGLRSPWVAYSALVLAVPLSTGSVDSMGRFGFMAFPLMWPLADWADASPRRRAWCIAAAAALTALLVAQLKICSL